MGQDRLLGRERLTEIAEQLGRCSSAAELLTAVRAAAEATPDDMAACILAPDAPVRAEQVEVEELETDIHALEAPHVAEFLAGCGVEPAEIASALERAHAVASAHEAVLLRVERRAGRVSLTVCAPPSPSEAQVGEPSRNANAAMALAASSREATISSR